MFGKIWIRKKTYFRKNTLDIYSYVTQFILFIFTVVWQLIFVVKILSNYKSYYLSHSHKYNLEQVLYIQNNQECLFNRKTWTTHKKNRRLYREVNAGHKTHLQ